MEWHDTSCPRLDLSSSNGFDSCMRCGSFSIPTTGRLFPPLSKQSDTRLLRLLPGDFSQDVHCEISVHDLSSRPVYEAISYTWADETGNDDLSKTILVSGEPLSVTRNCENALKRIRRQNYARIVWIDAVCINQNDKNERGHQVQLMPRIYSFAKNVLIYIGERTVDSDDCFHALGYGRIDTYDINQSDRLLASLRCLLGRQYFSRVWVLQEVALARTATVICGDLEMMWRQLCYADLVILPYRSEIRQLMDACLLKLRRAELYTTPDRALDLLDISCRCKAKDPRDKVYALLGLIIDHHRLGLAADYNLTVKELYIKVALGLASQYGWASVLFRAGTKYRSIDALPSWVPDWSHYLEKPFSLKVIRGLDDKALQCDYKDNSLILKAFALGFTDDSRVFLFKVAAQVVVVRNPRPSSRSVNQPYRFLLNQEVHLRLERFGLLSEAKHFISPIYYMRASEEEIVRNQFTFAMSHIETLSGHHCLVCAHDIATSITLTTVSAVSVLLKPLTRAHSLRTIGKPWYDFLVTGQQADFPSEGSESAWEMSVLSEWPSTDKLLLAIEHESRPLHDVDTLWRTTMSLDPRRQQIMRESKNISYDLLLDLNEAIWKLLVRLFLWRDIDVKII
ncbi:HET-domain-containing protein [Xylaria curta]|nr:HET-domain-containing protein [Xylaria curta]